MKTKLLPALVLLAVSALAVAQETQLTPAQVPPAVSLAVSKRYRGASISQWSKETAKGKTTYEASVSDATGKRDVVVAADGSLVAIEESMSTKDVPALVKNAVMKKYPHTTMKAAEKISHDGQVDYELDLTKASAREVTLSSEGKILKEE